MTNYENDPGARFYEEHMDDYGHQSGFASKRKTPPRRKSSLKRKTSKKASSKKQQFCSVMLTTAEANYIYQNLRGMSGTLSSKLKRYGGF